MGRPYATELEELHRTYAWALATSVESLADTIALSAHAPLLAVGSGGSLTAAHFACFLHTHFTGQSAQVFTPYELISSSQSLEDLTVMVLSAGGSNRDVLTCVEQVAFRLPRNLVAITTRTPSPLEELLRPLSWPAVHAFDTPTHKDGFLATNSLLATLVLLVRAYSAAVGVSASLPPTFDLLIHPGQTWQEYIKSWTREILPVIKRQTLVVLHGGATKTAAADIESRFTEAALGSVQVTDFRNFAHGRHYWLAVNAKSTAVLALSASQDRELATGTLSLIPKDIPRLRIDIDGTITGVLSSVCQSMYLAYIAGSHKGIDPGRPHVPMFGRKLYHLSAKPRSKNGLAMGKRMEAAIQSKAGVCCRTLAARGELDTWVQYYHKFITKLGSSDLNAVVCDYDGTLCAPRGRFEGPSDAITKKLTELLKAGLCVGIATGRGKSVREDLRKRIRSAKYRRSVVIAYHNGAEIGTLDNPALPPEVLPLAVSLQDLVEPLHAIPQVAKHAEITAKGSQITLQLSTAAELSTIFEAVSRVVRDIGPPGVTVVSSTHSVDVLAPGISKLLLLKHLQQSEIEANDSRVLCIGDRGRWPGNDADFLNHGLALSVDQVSRDPKTCWNLSAPGQRYDLTCLEYLDRLVLTKTGVRFNVEGLES